MATKRIQIYSENYTFLSFKTSIEEDKEANLRPQEYQEIEIARNLYRAEMSDFTV